MTPTYHLEQHPGRWEIWRTGGPCVAILPTHIGRREAERLARLLVAAANGQTKGKGTGYHAFPENLEPIALNGDRDMLGDDADDLHAAGLDDIGAK